jgi:signal transduction histidine kinase
MGGATISRREEHHESGGYPTQFWVGRGSWDCRRAISAAGAGAAGRAPTILDDFGLEAGLRWLRRGFRRAHRHPGGSRIQAPGRLPDETGTHLFRIARFVARAALTNVARHAAARRVEVKLESGGGEIRLITQYDDRGLAPEARQAARPGPRGMIGMRARARSAGGDITLRSRPGEGVLIEVRVPISGPAVGHTE